MHRRSIVVALAIAALASACGGASPDAGPVQPSQPVSTTPTPVTDSTSAAPVATPSPPAASSSDAPEISRSVGVEGGVVILWPRISGTKDPDSHQIAARIQQRFAAMVKRLLPGRPVDLRPEPERVCPRAGCKAVAVGAVLLRNNTACAVAALVSTSGTSPAAIIPWAGDLLLRNPTVPFRQAPESEIQIKDYATCAGIDDDLGAHDAQIEAAIRSAAGS
jgi:hypothetical protein